MRIRPALIVLGPLVVTFCALADDWPQWMGPRRDDIWREHGILERFPANGPRVLWRAPISGGYSGPAVVGNRLFVLDRPAAATAELGQVDERGTNTSKNERVLC